MPKSKVKKSSSRKTVAKSTRPAQKSTKAASSSPRTINKSKLLLFIFALFLAVAAYLTYQTMLTTPDINKIVPEETRRKPSNIKNPSTKNTPSNPNIKPVCSPGYRLQNGKCVIIK